MYSLLTTYQILLDNEDTNSQRAKSIVKNDSDINDSTTWSLDVVKAVLLWRGGSFFRLHNIVTILRLSMTAETSHQQTSASNKLSQVTILWTIPIQLIHQL